MTSFSGTDFYPIVKGMLPRISAKGIMHLSLYQMDLFYPLLAHNQPTIRIALLRLTNAAFYDEQVHIKYIVYYQHMPIPWPNQQTLSTSATGRSERLPVGVLRSSVSGVDFPWMPYPIC